MATKSITIDLEAFNLLKKAKRGNESYSQTIKRLFPEPFDLDAWLKSNRRQGISEDAANAIERHVAKRRERSRRR